MARKTDQELEALLQDSESDRVERKESWKGDAPEKGRQAVCAFANDLPQHNKPGLLFVGVKDSGIPSGLTVDDRLLQILADIKTDGKIVPQPSITVEKRILLGEPVAVVHVEPADAPPVRYDGRIWIRLGSRRGLASAQDERILNERRRHRDLPFDVQPLPSCPPTAISRAYFEEEYLPQAFASDILAANERTLDERLAACRMIHHPDNPTPTVMGVLTLCRSPHDWVPGAYIQFLRIQGKELSDPIVDEATIQGILARQIERVDDKLSAQNKVSVNIRGQLETRDYQYPFTAVQQLVRNAIMHRTYEHTNAPTRVTWFDDRIEIISPGGPYGVVTAENFGTPGVTDYRNRHLAEALKVLGFVQRFGVGISTARAELQKNGHPPLEFKIQPNFITAIIRAKSAA